MKTIAAGPAADMPSIGAQGTHARYYAGIETGGTKTLCRLVAAEGRTIAERRWPTADPSSMAETLCRFIEDAKPRDAALVAIGLATFGPVVINPRAADYGRMLNTPKPGWSGSNLAASLAQRLGTAVRVDTDVNAAAIAEQRLGAGRGCTTVAYVTVGTGIGGGLATAGGTLRGALHPEIGHIRLIRQKEDLVASCCPYHRDCAEGLCSGSAVARRLGPGERLEDHDLVQRLVADYLGQLLATLVLAWSPQRMVLGGGVMSSKGLIERVSACLLESLGDYGACESARCSGFLARAELEHAGLEGALLMALGE